MRFTFVSTNNFKVDKNIILLFVSLFIRTVYIYMYVCMYVTVFLVLFLNCITMYRLFDGLIVVVVVVDVDILCTTN